MKPAAAETDDDDEERAGPRQKRKRAMIERVKSESERASNVSVIRLPRCQSATVALYYVETCMRPPHAYTHCGNLLTIVLLDWPRVTPQGANERGPRQSADTNYTMEAMLLWKSVVVRLEGTTISHRLTTRTRETTERE